MIHFVWYIQWYVTIDSTQNAWSVKMWYTRQINCFSYRIVFQNDVKALSKLVLKNWVFVKKLKILYISDYMMWSKYLSNDVWRDFTISKSTLAIQQKLIFWSGILCYVADADIRSLKSIHILLGKYLDHMLVKFEQNRLVQNIQNLSFLTING